MDGMPNLEYERNLEAAVGALNEKRIDDAIDCCERAAKLEPAKAEHFYVFGLISLALNDLGETIKLMEDGHRRAPNCREFVDALSVLHARVGHMSESMYFAKLNLVTEPNPILAEFAPSYFSNFDNTIEHAGVSTYVVDAEIAFHQRRYADCIQLCERELRISADNRECNLLLGKAFAAEHEYERAIAPLTKVTDQEPDNLECHLILADILMARGKVDEAIDLYQETMDRHPSSLDVRNHYITAIAYLSEEKWAAYIKTAEDISRLLLEQAGKRGERTQLSGRVHIVFLVNEHALNENADFLDAFLRHYDRNQFKVLVYQQYSHTSINTSRLRALAADWRATFDIDDETLKLIIKNDGIDIIVDMCGSSSGNRQKLLSDLSGPLRASWLGFPYGGLSATTDVLLSSEGLIELDRRDVTGVDCFDVGGSLFAYGRGSVALEVDKDILDENRSGGNIVFGAQLDLANVMTSAQLWASVLKECPGSRLLLGDCGFIAEETIATGLEIFSGCGIGDRVDFQDGNQPDKVRAMFLSTIDVLLDAKCVNGTGLICDALWMGVPVVALRGNRRPSCVAAEILMASGFVDWIAQSEQQFTNLAVALANETEELRKLRGSMREKMQASALCNVESYTKRMQTVFRTIVDSYS